MKKHTNLDHEIQGGYHNDSSGLFEIIMTVLVGVIGLLLVLEHFGLVDAFIQSFN